ncbi:unnamed protein product [Allacma fusca]|uniref:Peptidase S8/S53 domain-containing protein n=1 Tax=Allacma fusca TaxID=39272 RepID=A0A8J2P5C0_9HEXA|nr:unnamed protein product [Allacma fusca]
MVSNFSSRGPSRRYEGFKPDVAAPGVDITSAATNSEVHYKTWSGTSMAAPHVAGVVALLKSKYPGLTVEQARDIVRQGVKGMVPVGENCQVDDSTYPNNQVGYGRIYAPACLEALKKITSPAWNVTARGESLGFILLAILFAYITVSV